KLKIITHHMGAMVPFLEARVGLGLDQLGAREGAEEGYRKIVADMKAKGKRPVDYFRQFYADTSINGSRAGMECGLSFFGIDHCLFGTDCPFDPEGGPLFIREIVKAVDAMKLSAADREKMYSGNARRLLRLA
ncbi:MAG: amidohydrolase family protein, partial [Stellaceae bacterium]